MKLVQRRRAVEDIDEHAAYIAERNTRAAYRFLDKVDKRSKSCGATQESAHPDSTVS